VATTEHWKNGAKTDSVKGKKREQAEFENSEVTLRQEEDSL
jgi:hypothetical protein